MRQRPRLKSFPWQVPLVGLEPLSISPDAANSLANPPDAGGAKSGALSGETGSQALTLDALAAALLALTPEDRDRLAALLTPDGKRG